MHSLMLSTDEINVLRGMMDIALKQLGGQAARTYVVLDNKLQAALSVTMEEPRPEPPLE